MGVRTIGIELQRLPKFAFDALPFAFLGKYSRFPKMSIRRIKLALELTSYSLPGSIETLLLQVEFDQLGNQRDVIRIELCGFFKFLSRLIIFFCSAIGQA